MIRRVNMALLAALVLLGGCSKQAKKSPPRNAICREVCVTAQCIGECLGGVTNGLEVLRIDARKLDCNGLFKTLSNVPDSALLWMPGEFDWLVTWRKDGKAISVAEMMERYSSLDNAEELVRSGCDSLAAVFASFVGAVREVRPAFASLKPTQAALPELFVTKDHPSLSEFDFSELDDDVISRLKTEVRSYQNARRMILEGCINSRNGKMEEAVDKWARAVKLHAGDPMLLERLSHLRANGEVFYKFGKYAMAMRCYDTMAEMRPNDPVPVFNYGVCAEKQGMKEVANAAFERARKLAAAKEGRK